MLNMLPDWLRLVLDLSIPILVGTTALARAAEAAADAYVDAALADDDPTNDARAKKILHGTSVVVKFLDALAENLPTIGRGTGSRR